MTPIRVLLTDDHIVLRQGLRTILERESDMLIIDEASSGNILLEKVRKGVKPDVVVMDVQMPGLSGVETTRELKRLQPETRVVALTAQEDESVKDDMLAAGAAAYVTKSAAAHQLVHAIHDALEAPNKLPSHRLATRRMPARAHLSQPMRQTRPAPESDPMLSCLTPRELQVLETMIDGYTNKEIATSLCISERTVQTHLSNIFAKMSVGSRTEALMTAMRNGWLTQTIQSV